MVDLLGLAPGVILEATDLASGDWIRIVVTAVLERDRVRARKIAYQDRAGPWEARLGQVGTWDLSKHDWRVV